MISLTVSDIMEMEPCEEYDRERVEELWDGRDSLTPIEIADLPIPAVDRLWVLLRTKIIPERDLHELACVFAENALFDAEFRCETVDPRSWYAISVKRRWIDGDATDLELYAARAAAWDAARAAAWAASRDAAWAAAMSASMAAAWAASREEQLQIVKEVLR